MTETESVESRWRVVSATGHRPEALSQAARTWSREKLLRAAEWLRDERGTEVGISGMARGVDLWWADAVHRAGLTLAAYVPCPQQPDPWSAGDRREWRRLLDVADPALYRQFGDEYDVRHLHARNRGMLLDSSAVVCVWLPTKRAGGTWSAVREAVRLGRQGVHLDPSSQMVRIGLPNVRRRA